MCCSVCAFCLTGITLNYRLTIILATVFFVFEFTKIVSTKKLSVKFSKAMWRKHFEGLHFSVFYTVFALLSKITTLEIPFESYYTVNLSTRWRANQLYAESIFIYRRRLSYTYIFDIFYSKSSSTIALGCTKYVLYLDASNAAAIAIHLRESVQCAFHFKSAYKTRNKHTEIYMTKII